MGRQVAERYNHGDSDLTLVSSDDVEFRIHKYQLWAASPVFRSMLAACDANGQTLQLTDRNIEASGAVQLLLDMIYGQPLKPPYSLANKVRNVYDLIIKYDCAAALQMWKTTLEAWASNDKADPWSVFIAAAHMDDWRLCCKAIKHRDWPWDDPDDDTMLDGHHDAEDDQMYGANGTDLGTPFPVIHHGGPSPFFRLAKVDYCIFRSMTEEDWHDEQHESKLAATFEDLMEK